MVAPPQGAGLGVEYDWDFITANQLAHIVYD
jgi:L-alanine-DL-glutamate epimerase-like enolase superfamily enzyme